MVLKQDLTNLKINELLVLYEVDEVVGSNGKSKRMWRCMCDCGKEVTLYHGSIKHGVTKSCGCRKKNMMNRNGIYKKHDGMRQLSIIKYRCYNEKAAYYHDYGARGINVCDEWLNDSISFCKWCDEIGWSKGSDLTIDRIDVDGDYSPENCRLSTKSMQAFKTRLTVRNTSGYPGVRWHEKSKRWKTTLKTKGITISGECFANKEDAIKERQRIEVEVYGETKINYDFGEDK